MSMEFWTEHGYGFPLFNGKNAKQVVKYICDRNIYGWREEEIAELMEQVDERDPSSTFQDFCDTPASWIIADIINMDCSTELFCGYRACGNTDQEEYIGIAKVYPWELKGNDFDFIKPSKRDEVLKKYAELLGIEETPDSFEAQYFG